MLGPARILFIIRNPADLVRSAYSQYLKREIIGAPRGRMPEVREINEWLAEGLELQRRAPAYHLDYAYTIEAFAEVFGRAAIQVCLFEEVTATPSLFGTRICETLGIDTGEGLRLSQDKRSNISLTQAEVSRLLEIRRSFWASWRFGLSPVDRRRNQLCGAAEQAQNNSPTGATLSAESLAKIAEATRDGNRRLLNQWGIPLDRYPYPL